MCRLNGKGTAVFTRLLRLLLTLAVVVVLLWFLAPRVFTGAANSLINSSVSQVQGLASFVPAGVSSLNATKGELQVNLTGLTPTTAYELALDRDQCGGSSTDLGSAQSDASGNLYIELPLTSLDTKQTWYIDVLQQGQSVACGQLQTNQEADAQVVDASQAGPNVFGPQPAPSVQPTQDTQSQGSTPTPGASSPNSNSSASTALPNMPTTGASPGSKQQYDNNQYPRKY